MLVNTVTASFNTVYGTNDQNASVKKRNPGYDHFPFQPVQACFPLQSQKLFEAVFEHTWSDIHLHLKTVRGSPPPQAKSIFPLLRASLKTDSKCQFSHKHEKIFISNAKREWRWQGRHFKFCNHFAFSKENDVSRALAQNYSYCHSSDAHKRIMSQFICTRKHSFVFFNTSSDKTWTDRRQKVYSKHS